MHLPTPSAGCVQLCPSIPTHNLAPSPRACRGRSTRQAARTAPGLQPRSQGCAACWASSGICPGRQTHVSWAQVGSCPRWLLAAAPTHYQPDLLVVWRGGRSQACGAACQVAACAGWPRATHPHPHTPHMCASCCRHRVPTPRAQRHPSCTCCSCSTDSSTSSSSTGTEKGTQACTQTHTGLQQPSLTAHTQSQ